MNTAVRLGMIAFTLVLAASSVAIAQNVRWGRATPPRTGACFYQDGAWNDTVSSLRVF